MPVAFVHEIGGPAGYGKDGGFATLENATPFPFFASHDGGGPSLSENLPRNLLGNQGTA